MDYTKQDVLLFFDGHASALPLYEAFEAKLLAMLPGTKIRVQKTQISFSGRRLFACVSLLRVKKKAELPGPYIVVTLCLPGPLDSPRAAAQTEPYPGRWTVHIPVGTAEEIDGELMEWVRQAYCFAQFR